MSWEAPSNQLPDVVPTEKQSSELGENGILTQLEHFEYSQNLRQDTCRLIAILDNDYYSRILEGDDDPTRILLILLEAAKETLKESAYENDTVHSQLITEIVSVVLNNAGISTRSLESYDSA